VTTVIIKTSELEGKALDWATGLAAGFKMSWNKITGQPTAEKNMQLWTHWEPSISWNQCGPLIDEYEISIIVCDDRICRYWARGYSWDPGAFGDTPKIAACRAIVAAKLGAEVEVPVVIVEGVKP
jgi:hypothetical protein